MFVVLSAALPASIPFLIAFGCRILALGHDSKRDRSQRWRGGNEVAREYKPGKTDDCAERGWEGCQNRGKECQL